MITAMISRLMILAFGTLYPAYASYKAVRTKDVREYVKWMMYWIVFALFTCVETFTDVLFSFWFPFYYEIKVALVFWLLSPATKGSSFLYRNFVHPAFQRRESEIDEMLSHAKEKGYNTVLSIGSRGVSYATNVLLQTAMRGGGGLVEHIKKSYSLTDLAPKVTTMNTDSADASGGTSKTMWGVFLDYLKLTDTNEKMIKSFMSEDNSKVDTFNKNLEGRPQRGRRGIAGSAANLEMRFSEVDVNIRQCPPNDLLSDIRSSEDISSGYSSTDQLYTEGVLTRSSSVSSTRARGRGGGGRSGQTRRTPLTEDSEGSDDSENVTPSSAKLSQKLSCEYSPTDDNIPSKNSSIPIALTKVPENNEINENRAYIIDSKSSLAVDNSISFDTTSDNSVVVETDSNILTEKSVDSLEKKTITIPDKSINISSPETTDSNLTNNNNQENTLVDNKPFCGSILSVDSIVSSASSSLTDLERKGKYKKKPAPQPPSLQKENEPLLLEEQLSKTEELLKKINKEVKIEETLIENISELNDSIKIDSTETAKNFKLKGYSSTAV